MVMGPPGPPVGGGGGSRKGVIGLAAAGVAIVILLVLISVALVRGRTGSVEPTQTVVAQAPASNTLVPATNTLVPSTQTPYILVVTATPAPPLPTTTRTPTSVATKGNLATPISSTQQDPGQTATAAAASTSPASTATKVPSTQTPTPVPAPTPFIPGGPQFAGPDKNAVEDRGGGWHRIRQTANLDNPAWTAEFRLTLSTGTVDGFAQWPHPMLLTLVNPTGKDVLVTLEIRRDQRAPAECNCDPYAQAFGSGRGGWFIGGSNADVRVNASAPLVLTGLGKYQMGFPRDFQGVWKIDLVLHPGAHVEINQGVARPDASDNWPLP